LDLCNKRLLKGFRQLLPGIPCELIYHKRYKTRSEAHVRVPAKRGIRTRIEVRNPDPSCNPYLAMAVMLTAGLDGIKNNLVCPPAVDRNIYKMEEAERQTLGIESMPGSLLEAVQELQKSELIKGALGKHIYDKFVEGKLAEWQFIISRYLHGKLLNI